MNIRLWKDQIKNSFREEFMPKTPALSDRFLGPVFFFQQNAIALRSLPCDSILSLDGFSKFTGTSPAT